jgi:hypothetical protein
MGYFEGLRRSVGHRPLLIIGAAVLVVDNQGQVLSWNAWTTVAGARLAGRSRRPPAATVHEETGPELFYRYPNGDEVYNLSTVDLARTGGSGASERRTRPVGRFSSGKHP